MYIIYIQYIHDFRKNQIHDDEIIIIIIITVLAGCTRKVSTWSLLANSRNVSAQVFSNILKCL